MSQAAMTASSLATISVAYKLGSITTVLLGKAVEGMTQTAISTVLSGKDADDTVEAIRRHSIQYMLMELDVEEKVSCTRALVANIRTQRENEMGPPEEGDYVEVCLKGVTKIMDEQIKVLHRIYNELDEHRLRWFSNWRSPAVEEDMVLLRTMCKVFDSRLDTLVKCLGVSTSAVACGEEERQKNPTAERLSQLGFFKGPPTDMKKYETENTTKEIVSTENMIFSDSVLL